MRRPRLLIAHLMDHSKQGKSKHARAFAGSASQAELRGVACLDLVGYNLRFGRNPHIFYRYMRCRPFASRYHNHIRVYFDRRGKPQSNVGRIYVDTGIA
jgi:hypothetical protein